MRVDEEDKARFQHKVATIGSQLQRQMTPEAVAQAERLVKECKAKFYVDC